MSVAEFAKCLSKLILYQSNNNSNNDNNEKNKWRNGGDGGGTGDDDHNEENDNKDMGEENFDANNNNNNESGGYQQPSFYGPFDYDVDLINSVLLRGAGCPGDWNANTDNLWVALPPPSSSRLQNDSMIGNPASKQSSNGDQEWLEKLAESVNLYAGTTSTSSASVGDGKSVKSSTDQSVRTAKTLGSNTVAATKKKVVKKKPSATGDTRGDSQDVQDFFAGLLNK